MAIEPSEIGRIWMNGPGADFGEPPYPLSESEISPILTLSAGESLPLRLSLRSLAVVLDLIDSLSFLSRLDTMEKRMAPFLINFLLPVEVELLCDRPDYL